MTAATEIDRLARIPARAILLDPDPVRRDQLSEALELFLIGVTDVADGNEALEVLEDDHALCVAVSRLAILGLNGLEFAKRAKYVRPHLRCLVMCPATCTGERRQLEDIGCETAVDEPFDAREIAGQVASILDRHLYEPGVIPAIARGLNQVVEITGVQDLLHQHQPFLRCQGNTLEFITALVDIRGDVSGSLMVSGPASVFAHMREGWLDSQATNRLAVWDAAGELANRLASLLCEYYLERGFASHQSFPTITQGRRMRVRHGSDQLVLVMPFSVNSLGETLYVEWLLAATSIKTAGKANRPATIELF